jgi:hypothetical protein
MNLSCGHSSPAPSFTSRQAAAAFGRVATLLVTCPQGCGLVETVPVDAPSSVPVDYSDPWGEVVAPQSYSDILRARQAAGERLHF